MSADSDSTIGLMREERDVLLAKIQGYAEIESQWKHITARFDSIGGEKGLKDLQYCKSRNELLQKMIKDHEQEIKRLRSIEKEYNVTQGQQILDMFKNTEFGKEVEEKYAES
jgi:hypothetical protein